VNAVTPNALIFDRDSRHTRELASALTSTGFEVVITHSVGDIDFEPQIAFLCMDLSGVDILQLMANKAFENTAEFILMASEDDPPSVRRAIAQGATYFFCKPFDPDFLRPLLDDLFAEADASAGQSPESDSSSLDQFGYLRGSSPPMRKLYRILRKVAATDTSVLLIGESGTGKELVARTLHQLSGSIDAPFVAMNCGAIPKELFESELFGHEKGSFSGAERTHRGFFERADGGTLFLDEITEMPLELQVKLLRVLESGAFRRVGAESDLVSNVRIIAATNRPPDEATEENLLREDLYYRIARFPVWLPPLRDRGTDVVGLTRFFLTELNEKNSTTRAISPSAIEEIERHSWPGNVRELRSVLERAYILADDEIGFEHLPELKDEIGGPQLRISVGESIEDAERKLIFATLEANDGDKVATAEALKVSLRTLYNRLNQYAETEPGSDDSDSAS